MMLHICLTCRLILHKLLIFNSNAYNFGNYFTSFAPVATLIMGKRTICVRNLLMVGKLRSFIVRHDDIVYKYYV